MIEITPTVRYQKYSRGFGIENIQSNVLLWFLIKKCSHGFGSKVLPWFGIKILDQIYSHGFRITNTLELTILDQIYSHGFGIQNTRSNVLLWFWIKTTPMVLANTMYSFLNHLRATTDTNSIYNTTGVDSPLQARKFCNLRS